LASGALLTTLHPLLENVLQTVDHFEMSCLGAPLSCLKNTRNRVGRDVNCLADDLMGFHRSTFSKPKVEFDSDLAPCDFWAFPTMKRELHPTEEISKLSMVCSTLSRSGWSVVGNASLDGGGTSKKRPSPHLRKVPTRSNKASPRTLQMAFVFKNSYRFCPYSQHDDSEKAAAIRNRGGRMHGKNTLRGGVLALVC
jgi:hypothetical protein